MIDTTMFTFILKRLTKIWSFVVYFLTNDGCGSRQEGGRAGRQADTCFLAEDEEEEKEEEKLFSL